MSFRRSYNYDIDSGLRRSHFGVIGLLTLCTGIFLGTAVTWYTLFSSLQPGLPGRLQPALRQLLVRPITAGSSQALPALNRTTAASATLHRNITTTVFWIGEPSGPENGFIANNASYWDDHWQNNYGGVDSPGARRGYLPAAFNPHENPFYVALPYGDVTAKDARKASASTCLAYAPNPSGDISWCKNNWLKISHGGRVVYAQWEDVGPNEEDDAAYVFGSGSPKNTFGAHAGLDVSPAVRDYLGLQDVDITSWEFVSPKDVPTGPWAQIATTSPYYFQ